MSAAARGNITIDVEECKGSVVAQINDHMPRT